jgi:plastocyanin
MRTAFRFASLLLALLLLLVYFGAGTEGLLGHAPTLRGTSTPSDTSGACTNAVVLDAYDPYNWGSSSISDVCLTTTFTVTNMGAAQHTFTVSNLTNKTDPSSSSNSWFFTGYFPTAGPYDWLNASSTISVTITFPSMGSYEFTCMPHYSLDMYGEIYVLENAPAPPPPPPSFEPFWYIVAIVGTLAVLSVVGGLVYGKAGAESSRLEPGGPVTSYPEYFNDSRPEPLDSAEPMKRGGGGPH